MSKYTEPQFPVGPDGKKDYLKVDPSIPGQTWACLSFISPEDMVQKKNLFYFNNFLYNEINKTLKDQAVHMAKETNYLLRQVFESKIEKLRASVNEIDKIVADHLNDSYKSLQINEEEYANKCMHLYAMDQEDLTDKFSIYKINNYVELDKQFDEENNYKCSVRGLKIRGVFGERKEAENKAKQLREEVEQGIHVFVAPAGYWLPWDPDPDAVQDSDYMLPQLNDLMGKYHENVKEKNKFFEERKQEMVDQAELSNKERTKQRLRAKLMEKRNAKIQEEIMEDTSINADKMAEELMKEEASKKKKKSGKKPNNKK